MTDGPKTGSGCFGRILLATDGSEFSDGAKRAAMTLARNSGAHLHMMSMVITNPEYEALAPQLVAKAENQCAATLHKLEAEAAALGVQCTSHLRHGYDPAVEICGLADELAPGIISMGRRGRRGLARFMVGDATAKVIGHANYSVLVVPKAADMWKKRILLAVDGSAHSEAAAVVARDVAMCSGHPVTVMSVQIPEHSEVHQAEAPAVAERVAGFLAHEGVLSDFRVARGHAADAIITTAAEIGADLIVVGSHGRTGLGKALLGSVSERVLGQTKCAVLVVRGQMPAGTASAPARVIRP